MKFTVAASLLALGTASAFVTPQAYGRTQDVVRSMTATETSVYTFEKSEEIFAEAQTVRKCKKICFDDLMPLDLELTHFFPFY